MTAQPLKIVRRRPQPQAQQQPRTNTTLLGAADVDLSNVGQDDFSGLGWDVIAGGTKKRTLRDRHIDVVNVLDFIDPTLVPSIKNGTLANTTDLTSSINAATAKAAAYTAAGIAAEVYFPAGTYYAAGIQFYDGMRIRGASRGATTISQPAGSTGNVFVSYNWVNNNTTCPQNVILEDLNILGCAGSTGGDGIVWFAQVSLLRNIWITGFAGAGVRPTSKTANGTTMIGGGHIHNNHFERLNIKNCVAGGLAGTGITGDDNGTDSWLILSIFNNCGSRTAGVAAIELPSGAPGWTIAFNKGFNCPSQIADIGGSRNVEFIGNNWDFDCTDPDLVNPNKCISIIQAASQGGLKFNDIIRFTGLNASATYVGISINNAPGPSSFTILGHIVLPTGSPLPATLVQAVTCTTPANVSGSHCYPTMMNIPVAQYGNAWTAALPQMQADLGLTGVANSRTPISDADYTILATDRDVALITPLTAARTWTLPPATSMQAGQILWVTLNVTSMPFSLTFQADGTDKINGSSTLVVSTARAVLAFVCSGGTNWAVDGRVIGAEQTSNKGAASGYAGLDGSSKVPIANLPTGTTSSTVAIGNDSRITGAEQTTNKGVANGYASLNSSALLTASQVPALTGDVTKVAGAPATTLATAQPGAHTWAATQTFTLAPVFTDASGSRTALGVAYGTTGSTVAVGNDSRITGALQTANGLSEFSAAQASTARASLKLSTTNTTLTDANATINVSSGMAVYDTSTLTVNRNLTLATTNAAAGDEITYRRASADAFSRVVKNNAGTTLVSAVINRSYRFRFVGTDWVYWGSTTD